jgi:hypothetical protein
MERRGKTKRVFGVFSRWRKNGWLQVWRLAPESFMLPQPCDEKT